MIRVSDIMDKEIINVKNGKKMGFINVWMWMLYFGMIY